MKSLTLFDSTDQYPFTTVFAGGEQGSSSTTDMSIGQRLAVRVILQYHKHVHCSEVGCASDLAVPRICPLLRVWLCEWSCSTTNMSIAKGLAARVILQYHEHVHCSGAGCASDLAVSRICPLLRNLAANSEILKIVPKFPHSLETLFHIPLI